MMGVFELCAVCLCVFVFVWGLCVVCVFVCVVCVVCVCVCGSLYDLCDDPRY